MRTTVHPEGDIAAADVSSNDSLPPTGSLSGVCSRPHVPHGSSQEWWPLARTEWRSLVQDESCAATDIMLARREDNAPRNPSMIPKEKWLQDCSLCDGTRVCNETQATLCAATDIMLVPREATRSTPIIVPVAPSEDALESAHITLSFATAVFQASREGNAPRTDAMMQAPRERWLPDGSSRDKTRMDSSSRDETCVAFRSASSVAPREDQAPRGRWFQVPLRSIAPRELWFRDGSLCRTT